MPIGLNDFASSFTSDLLLSFICWNWFDRPINGFGPWKKVAEVDEFSASAWASLVWPPKVPRGPKLKMFAFEED